MAHGGSHFEQSSTSAAPARPHLWGTVKALAAEVMTLEALDDETLRGLQRLLRDLDHEKQMAVQQARLQPWRR